MPLRIAGGKLAYCIRVSGIAQLPGNPLGVCRCVCPGCERITGGVALAVSDLVHCLILSGRGLCGVVVWYLLLTLTL